MQQKNWLLGAGMFSRIGDWSTILQTRLACPTFRFLPLVNNFRALSIHILNTCGAVISPPFGSAICPAEVWISQVFRPCPSTLRHSCWKIHGLCMPVPRSASSGAQVLTFHSEFRGTHPHQIGAVTRI